mmetsp:Transcript_71541/g.207140  ORF Transcript_71541/g.207140 Transcript_71541/m.207140 type:complete len:202 (+) Transcript_71541:57-662(+)
MPAACQTPSDESTWFWEKLRLACAERALDLDLKLPNNLHGELARTHPELFAPGRVRERAVKKMLLANATTTATDTDAAATTALPRPPAAAHGLPDHDMPRPPEALKAPPAPPAFMPLPMPRSPSVSLITGKPLPGGGSPGVSDCGGSTRAGSALTSARSVASSVVPPSSLSGLSRELGGLSRDVAPRAAGGAAWRPPRPCV